MGGLAGCTGKRKKRCSSCRVGFFSSVVMWALLKDDGKQPEEREEFTRELTNGRMSGVMVEGIGSMAQVAGPWGRAGVGKHQSP